MADVFTWLPDDKPNGQFDLRVRDLQFGDGYRQISKDGMNARKQVWPVSFDRHQSVTAAIQDFLDDHHGEWFLWTPPGSNSVQGKYICLSYGKVPHGGDSEKLTATFEEFAAP